MSGKKIRPGPTLLINALLLGVCGYAAAAQNEELQASGGAKEPSREVATAPDTGAWSTEQLVVAQDEFPIPCDELQEPIELAYGSHTTGCGFNPMTDLDRFEFMGTAGDRVRVTACGTTNGVDPEMDLRDPLLGQIDTHNCIASSNETCCFSEDYDLSEDGTYFLNLSEVSTNQTGNYTLQLERLPPDPIPDALLHDEALSDGLSPQTDTDFFAYEGTANAGIRVTVAGTTNGFDPALEIWDPAGELLDAPSCVASSNEKCSLSQDYVLPSSGTYVFALHEVSTNQTGNYTIQLFEIPPDPLPLFTSYNIPRHDSISPVTDMDFFTFLGVPLTEALISVSGLTNGFDPDVELWAPDGSVTPFDCIAASNERCTAQLSVVLNAGTYLVGVSEVSTNQTGSYQLLVQCEFGDCPTDLDTDGIPDPLDNCTVVSNEDQRDTDADGLGNICDPDLNGDCMVDFEDLAALKECFFGSDPTCDLDGDGSVNFADLTFMKDIFFQSPGPSGVDNACD